MSRSSLFFFRELFLVALLIRYHPAVQCSLPVPGTSMVSTVRTGTYCSGGFNLTKINK